MTEPAPLEDSGNPPGETPPPESNWYDTLDNVDLRNNPTLQKYESQEAANQGHLKLAESFGMEKQVWPKDDNDTERWAEVNGRLGVPEKAEGYDLEGVVNPEGVQLFDKARFQEMLHKHDAPKKVADGLWKDYTESMNSQYADAQTQFDANVEASKNELKQEWGEAYEGKIKGGNAVIETLAGSQEQKDALTVALAQTPDGMRFLASIHGMMKESSVGGFQVKESFTKTPAEAQTEIDTIKAGSDYRSDDIRIRQPQIDRVLDLRNMIKIK